MTMEIIKHLRAGGLIIYPTETAYGLGCDATNQKAVDKVFKIKMRPKIKSLPLIAGSLSMVKKNCFLSKEELKLAKRYWPGALTLVLKNKNKDLAGGTVAKDVTVAVRVSGGKIARGLSQKLGQLLVSTSANISGENECYSLKDVCAQFPNLEKHGILLIDGGRLLKKKPSTIARIENKKVQILRQGDVKVD